MKIFRRARKQRERRAALERHWREERSYWSERLRGWYRAEYGLELDPIQDDLARVPPPELVARIQKSDKAEPLVFVATGQRTVLAHLEALRDHGADPRRFARVLEFGVGLGRLIRHYYPFPARLHGCDVTEEVVAYSRACYGDRVEVVRNELSPPLPYDAGCFDYVYASSVFTHIQAKALPGWIAELARVIRAGGWLIASVYGADRYLGHVAERDYDRMLRGPGYLEWGSSHVKENCFYATEAVLREFWGRHFEVKELRPRFKDQDLLVLRRP